MWIWVVLSFFVIVLFANRFGLMAKMGGSDDVKK